MRSAPEPATISSPPTATTRIKFYEISGGKAKRIKPSCPRCGPGVFLGEHKNRLACGKCGYTEFKK
ncbi:MAG: 30S ribosomal protein S27ae [Candidatus Methanoperedens sp.]|nr:30S ribosomal protein S27ae [Candidatus Methanoperedens sp.]